MQLSSIEESLKVLEKKMLSKEKLGKIYSHTGKKSKHKGSRREREWANFLKFHGAKSARRSAQFNGKEGLGDVIAPDDLPEFSMEVKGTENFPVHKYMRQARQDAKGLIPMIAQKKSSEPWLVVMDATDWLKLVLKEKYIEDEA